MFAHFTFNLIFLLFVMGLHIFMSRMAANALAAKVLAADALAADALAVDALAANALLLQEYICILCVLGEGNYIL